MSTPSEPGAPVAQGGIPLSVPLLRGNEWLYVRECLDTNWISSAGPYVNRFERDMAVYLGIKRGVAVVNGTAGLHIALLVAGVQAEDEVIVPALTFVAPVNAARYCGAWPVFMDVQPDTWQMDVDKVAEFMERETEVRNGQVLNRRSGRTIRAILPVHILGHPVDMDPLLDLAQRFGLTVVEDATEALGARYKGRPAGSLGRLAVLSFNGNKLISTGGGGMIVTNDEDLADRAHYLTTQAKDDPVEYIHGAIGYNYRLPNILAAIGVAQLEQVEAYIAAKRQIAARYAHGLSGISGLTLPSEASWAFHTFWLYTLLVDEEEFGMSSRQLLRGLAEHDIQSRPLWHPIHTLPPYRDCLAYRVDIVNRLYRDALSIPCSVGLEPEAQARVIQVIQELAGA